MLLFEKKDYKSEFHIYGQLEAASRLHGSTVHLNTSLRVDYRPFEPLPQERGTPFARFEYTDHESLITLVGHVAVHYNAIDDKGPYRGMTVLDLMIWYHRNKVAIPFNQWIYLTPMLRDRRERSNFSILRSDGGNYYLFWIERGVVKYEALTETCFIHNGIITPLALMADKCEQAALKQLEETRAFLTAIRDPEEWQLAEKLSGSELLRYVGSH